MCVSARQGVGVRLPHTGRQPPAPSPSLCVDRLLYALRARAPVRRYQPLPRLPRNTGLHTRSALGRATPNVYTDRALVIACASCEGRSTVLGACGAARCTRGLRGSRWSTVPRASPPTVCVVSLARPALLCASCSFRSMRAPCLSHTLTPFAQRGPPLAQSWDAALVRAGAVRWSHSAHSTHACVVAERDLVWCL